MIRFLGLIFLLLGCSSNEPTPIIEPYAEQLALSNAKVQYTGQFQYSLTNCEGLLASFFNNHSLISSRLEVNIDRSRIEFIRHDKVYKPKIIGNWNSNDRTLSRMRLSSTEDNWGIADEEGWENSIGVMELQQDEISGQIKNITMSSEETLCEVELRFTGVAV